MAQYHVDSERIQSSASAVSSSIESIRGAVQTMYANLTELQDAWQGSAALRFSSVVEQWRSAQQQMEQSLQSIHSALTQASTVYADAETQAAQLFSS